MTVVVPVDDVAAASADPIIGTHTMAAYVPLLRSSDDDFRLRLILHEFGLAFQHASPPERVVLLASEPPLFDQRWDAFLAAYAEHLSYHAALPAPVWASAPERYLSRFWFAVRRFPRERAGTILTTPGHFEAHGIWFPRRELVVV